MTQIDMYIRYRNGRSYAYESVRVGNKVKACYVGAGEFGEFLANADHALSAAAALKHTREAATVAQTEREMKERDKLSTEAFDEVEDVLAALLVAAGFHRTNRGPWRKQRGKRASTD